MVEKLGIIGEKWEKVGKSGESDEKRRKVGKSVEIVVHKMAGGGHFG